MRPHPQRRGEPLTKRCSLCGEERWIAEFRILVSGSRAAYDQDCEAAYDRERKARPGARIKEVAL